MKMNNDVEATSSEANKRRELGVVHNAAICLSAEGRQVRNPSLGKRVACDYGCDTKYSLRAPVDNAPMVCNLSISHAQLVVRVESREKAN